MICLSQLSTLVPRETEHLATNLWLIGQCGARGVVERRQVVIDGLGLTRAQTTDEVIVRQPPQTT